MSPVSDASSWGDVQFSTTRILLFVIYGQKITGTFNLAPLERAAYYVSISCLSSTENYHKTRTTILLRVQTSGSVICRLQPLYKLH